MVSIVTSLRVSLHTFVSIPQQLVSPLQMHLGINIHGSGEVNTGWVQPMTHILRKCWNFWCTIVISFAQTGLPDSAAHAHSNRAAKISLAESYTLA